MSVDTTMADAAFDAATAADAATAIPAMTLDPSAHTASDADNTPETNNTADTNTAPETDTASEADTAPATDAVPNTKAVLDTGTEVTFASLDLPAPLLSVLDEAGVVTAFPIQAATIPDALIGRDVLGRGRTGSGKTLAFGLPTLTRLEGLRAKPRRPLALVLVPTRELAMQVEDALRPYARALRLRIRSVYGGAPMGKQIDNLRYGVELLVATPGRLSDLIERGECELGEVDVAILDEADQMCDMGFMPHVCELMDQVVEGGQRLLFSATLDGAVDEIVKKYMNDPVLHEVDPQAGAVSTMSHHLLMVAPQYKAKVAAQIAGRHSAEGGNADARSIFFVRTQMAVDRVTEQLRERGLPAAGLHGGMTQVLRTKTLEDFKEGRTPVLIATDVAARGIHVDGIDLVVHIDPPRDSKDYLHRAGRTARAGQAGVVASLVLPKQRKQAQRMMDDAGVTAEELDAAPLGVGGRSESASAALARLTGAREVPEPGDVKPFTLPARERAAGSNERRGGDRYGRDDRRGGFGSGGSGSRNSYPSRDGGRYGRDEHRSASAERGTERRSFEGRGSEGRGFEGRGFARRDFEARGPEKRGFEKRDFEKRDFEKHGFEGRGSDGRGSDGRGSAERAFEGRGTEGREATRRGFDGGHGANGSPERGRDERQNQSQDRFVRRDGDRSSYSHDDRRSRPFDRREGDRYSRDRDGWRDGNSSANRGPEGRSFGGRNFDGRGTAEPASEARGQAGRGSDERNPARRGFEGRGFENRGSGSRGSEGGGFEKRSYEGRGADTRGFKERSFKERSADDRGRFSRDDRNRDADRSGHGDRFGRDDRRGAGSRPRPGWDRGKPQHTSRDGKPRS
jgi:superfamily II DNA/RNA helicase